jgi:DNA modification methylase
MDALRMLRMLPERSVDCIVTDPPYGCGSQVSAWRSPDKRFNEIAGVDEIDHSWLPDAFRVLRDGAAMYCFAKWINMGEWKAVIEAVGFKVTNCIIWDKMQHGTGDLWGAYAPQYEMILFATKGRHLLRGIRPTDVIRFSKVQPGKLSHPYEKPVGLIEKLIRASTDTGGVVVECFAGSGSTLQAAFNTQRYYIGGDIAAEYVALANKRLDKPYTLPLFTEAAS